MNMLYRYICALDVLEDLAGGQKGQGGDKSAAPIHLTFHAKACNIKLNQAMDADLHRILVPEWTLPNKQLDFKQSGIEHLVVFGRLVFLQVWPFRPLRP